MSSQPAYPCTTENGCNTGWSGMTLRENFASKILQGFCANPAIFAPDSRCGWSLANCTEDQLVGYARDLSEKMMQALKEAV